MDTEVATLNEEFIVEFECPICTKYMVPPIGQCTNGHCFCPNCFKQIRICALCRAPKSQYRCVTLEKIHACLTFPCVYVDQGCDFQAPGGSISTHQKICKFSLVPCPLRFNACDWRGEKSELVSHCKVQHSDNIFFSSKQRLTSSRFRDKIDRVYHIMFYVFSKLFRCTWDLDKVTGLIRFAVYCLGDHDEFGFEVSYMVKGSEEEVVSVRAPCYSMEDDSARFLQNKYFVLHHENIKELCDEDGDLNYVVNIFEKN